MMSNSTDPRPRQALIAWGIFMILLVLFNGTIPFFLGRDLHAWTGSTIKVVLLSLFVYGGMFLVVPLWLTKGWQVVRQPAFFIPLMLAILGILLWWPVNHYAAAVVVFVLAYLHWRFDLSGLGFRSLGIKGDIAAILLMGVMSLIPLFLRGMPEQPQFAKAFMAGLERLFGNPASTVENLFYFGFLTEALSRKTGRWLTPPLVGAMYTLHEMSNPEYWYSGMSFVFVFVAITLTAYIYLWRRSVVVVWLGDGLSRFITRLV